MLSNELPEEREGGIDIEKHLKIKMTYHLDNQLILGSVISTMFKGRQVILTVRMKKLYSLKRLKDHIFRIHGIADIKHGIVRPTGTIKYIELTK